MSFRDSAEGLVSEKKRLTGIVSEFVIEAQHMVDVMTQIFLNANAKSAAEYGEACEYLRDLCDRMVSSSKQLKEVIPITTNKELNEIKE